MGVLVEGQGMNENNLKQGAGGFFGDATRGIFQG